VGPSTSAAWQAAKNFAGHLVGIARADGRPLAIAPFELTAMTAMIVPAELEPRNPFGLYSSAIEGYLPALIDHIPEDPDTRKCIDRWERCWDAQPGATRAAILSWCIEHRGGLIDIDALSSGWLRIIMRTNNAMFRCTKGIRATHLGTSFNTKENLSDEAFIETFHRDTHVEVVAAV
jgi:hypothetical protein